jgi:hypothetical protein
MLYVRVGQLLAEHEHSKIKLTAFSVNTKTLLSFTVIIFFTGIGLLSLRSTLEYTPAWVPMEWLAAIVACQT